LASGGRPFVLRRRRRRGRSEAPSS
jgi:hypothetical protein